MADLNLHHLTGRDPGQHGCECLRSEEPPFAYTTGLFGLAHPELLIVGVDPQTAAGVLNDLGNRVPQGGSPPRSAHRIREVATLDNPRGGAQPRRDLLGANAYYQRLPDYSVQRCSPATTTFGTRFPREEGCAAPKMHPRPGTLHRVTELTAETARYSPRPTCIGLTSDAV